MLETLKQWDNELFIFLNNLGVAHFDGFWVFVTQIESWTALIIFFILLIFYYYKGKKSLVVLGFLVLTFGVTMLFTGIVKEYVARLRPHNIENLSELIRILQKPSSYSFFSGHASSSFAITTFVVLVIRKHTKWIYLAFLWPLLFSMSRIYVGVHYPSDILVGTMVGISFAFLFYTLFLRYSIKTQLE